MKYYTQTELLNKKSEYSDRGVMGIYVLADQSKLSKSMISTSLVNTIANYIYYLGLTNKQSKVIYFDNENYDQETQQKVQALKAWG